MIGLNGGVWVTRKIQILNFFEFPSACPVTAHSKVLFPTCQCLVFRVFRWGILWPVAAATGACRKPPVFLWDECFSWVFMGFF